MKIFLVAICASISISLLGQGPINVESFYPEETEMPANYQSIVFDPKGWTFVAEYYLDHRSIITEPKTGSPQNIIFYKTRNMPRNDAYSKVKGNRLIHYEDRRATDKIVYLNEHTLIVEGKTFRYDGVKSGNRGSAIIEEQIYVPTKSRTIYQR